MVLMVGLSLGLGVSVGQAQARQALQDPPAPKTPVPWFMEVAQEVKGTAQGVGRTVGRGVQGAFRGVQKWFSPFSPDLEKGGNVHFDGGLGSLVGIRRLGPWNHSFVPDGGTMAGCWQSAFRPSLTECFGSGLDFLHV